jgi:hypothetical protein
MRGDVIMGSRYDQVWDGDWWTLPKKMDMQCCDCGLVHSVYFRIRTEGGQPFLEMRMDRNERATAAVRRVKKRSRNVQGKNAR